VNVTAKALAANKRIVVKINNFFIFFSSK